MSINSDSFAQSEDFDLKLSEEKLSLNNLNSDKAPSDSSLFGEYKPGVGFNLLTTKMGDVNFKVFAYIRYINQQGLDTSYTDAFGRKSVIDRRHDIQLNKVNIQFLGWFLDPKLRYLFYVWTSNTALGQLSQVVVAGNIKYVFSNYFSIGAGVNALPGVRSTEGNFPFWVSLDNRVIADEFFRPSYTTGLWFDGSSGKSGLIYGAMIGNNLSQFGVDAGQLDNVINTISGYLAWFPTTGEFGTRSSFGDFEDHKKVATRIAVHHTFSEEDKESQPRSDAFENVQLRFSDGTIIFTPDIFGPGIRINNATYNMSNADAGIKFKGLSLNFAYYYRILNKFGGDGINLLPFDKRTDQGYSVIASGMIVPKLLQLYGTYSKVIGQYGNPFGARGGLNYFPYKNQNVRFNLEYIYMDNSPVGGLSLPYLVGSKGSIVHLDFLVNF